MIKYASILMVIIFVIFGSSGFAGDRRVALDAADVTAASGDTLIAVPVYMSFPDDSLAGVEVYFRIDDNRRLRFASDAVRADGILVAADTVGSVLSGWEWIGVSSLENGVYDLKVAGMADWPNQTVTPPAGPQEKSLFVTLYFRADNSLPVEDGTRYEIRIDQSETSFADPRGRSIGVVTTYENRCQEYLGDSCLVWKTVRVGTLDTTVVQLSGGSITIADSLGTGH